MIREYIHKSLAAGRWFELSLSEQLGNIGSEYNRAIAAKRKGDQERYQNASNRTLDFANLPSTISDGEESLR